MICSICGKKQNPLISDFPLYIGSADRICSPCQEHKNALEECCHNDFSRYCIERDYFISFFDTQQISPAVCEYMKALLSECQSLATDLQNSNLIKDNYEKEQLKKQEADTLLRQNFTMTNGYNFEGYTIIKYNGVVCSETVLGTGIISELSAGFADFLGIESTKMASKFEDARNSTILKLVEKAINIKANALIGLNFNYTSLSGNTIAIIANATAVTIQANA